MKRRHLLLSFFILAFLPNVVSADPIIKHLGIVKTNIDVSSTTVVGEITIEPAEAGKVIVRFDGNCWSTPGDAIILAASDAPSWSVNDGNIAVEALDTDIRINSFSHTRVYSVTAGAQTFYAVAHNYVETDGDGMASIYGSLTVEFIPSGDNMVRSIGIEETNIDLNSLTVLGEISMNPSVTGKVIVRFDGHCYATPGDRIVLAASDAPSWTSNDGNVNMEATDGDVNHRTFSHTRVYDVAAGSQKFYAVAQNYVETDGDGIASIYGTLTIEFVPAGDKIVGFTGIAESGIDVSNVTPFADITIEPPVDGRVIVTFDGMCLSSAGDRIVLAASDNVSWSTDDGNVSVEAIDADLNRNGFSHTRSYDVAAGTHTFYAVVQNYVEKDGDGIASVYGSLTVKFVPQAAAVSVNDVFNSEYNIYPIPANDVLNVEGLSPNSRLSVYSISGKELMNVEAVNSIAHLSISDLAQGVYFLKISEKGNSEILKFVKE
jgi:hypothetical protein